MLNKDASQNKCFQFQYHTIIECSENIKAMGIYHSTVLELKQ